MKDMPSWLGKPQVRRVFLYSSWTVAVAGAFMLFMITPLFSIVSARTSGELVLKILGGVIGTLGAVSALVIWPGMLLFWFREDRSPPVDKAVWLVLFFVTAWFGSAVYFFRVYSKQVGRSS
jgi:hypothetical protein